MSSTPHKGKQRKERTVDQQIRRRTIISFVVFFMCLAAGYYAWLALYREQGAVGNVPPTLTKALAVNENIFSFIFNGNREAKHFDRKDAASKVRVNGYAGMGGVLDTATWRLRVVRAAGDTLVLTLNDIKALPKTEVIFDFKCIEGWSQVTWWTGVRVSEFVKAYGLAAQSEMKYVGMVTPDRKYYVGNDMPSMMQGQTILCYEMNGRPLPQNQGYPLRLIIPVKYGIKHLKRIGLLYFSNEKPPDYWAQYGYDYYSGL